MAENGKKLEQIPVNFHIPLEDRIRAAAGIPAYIRRLRRIEDLTTALVHALDEVYEEEWYQERDRRVAAQAVREQVEKLDLSLLNDLIDRHNKYYPIEANLPVDPKTNRFLYLGKPWSPMKPMTAGDIHALFLDHHEPKSET